MIYPVPEQMDSLRINFISERGAGSSKIFPVSFKALFFIFD